MGKEGGGGRTRDGGVTGRGGVRRPGAVGRREGSLWFAGGKTGRDVLVGEVARRGDEKRGEIGGVVGEGRVEEGGVEQPEMALWALCLGDFFERPIVPVFNPVVDFFCFP